MFHLSMLAARRSGAAFCLALWLVAGGSIPPLLAAPKGAVPYKQGRKAELRKDYDQALELYERAQQQDPENQTYQLAVRRMHFVAGQWHAEKGNKLLEKGNLLEAAAEFEKAVAIDPASSIADQQLKRTLALIAQRSAGKPAPGAPEAKTPPPAPPPSEPVQLPILAAKKETEAMLETAQSIPRLKPISTTPINLKISNNSKVVYETVGKLTGVNVLFDPEYQDRKITLELSNATLMDALDYVSTIAKAFWKPLSANAIFVTNDNTTKRRDYEEQVLKTFYLTNAYTAQELQEIATAVRSAADIRRLYTVNSLNAMVVRAEADKVALAEKIIHDIDKGRAEVIIDVLVLEVSTSKTRELGLTPVSGGTPGISVPISLTPVNPTPSTGGSGGNGGTNGDGGTARTTGSTSTNTGGGYTFGKTDQVNFSLALPGAGIKALMSSSDSRVLQSPRIRGFDGYKASLRIGDRIPIATGSFQPGIGGVGINPLVNTQFNYQDVGVNVDLTPRIHAGKEISMHIEIEISNVRSYVDIGGISQPVIGQRKVLHDIRLKEGEGNIIGGLMQTQTSRIVSGVPGLGQIPLLCRLFSNERLEKSENEILIVLLPHIVRVPELTDLNMRGISSGTEQQVKVTFTPAPNNHPPLPPAPESRPAAPAPLPPAVAAPPAPVPETRPPAADSPAPLPSSRAENLVSRLRFDRTTASEAAGARITLNLLADNVTELFAAPLRIRFDPKVLQLSDARRGVLLSMDGQDVMLSKNIENDRGEASVQVSRFPGSPGVSGSGILLILEFQTVAPGKSAVSVSSETARNVRLEPIAMEAASAEVVIQ